jgi:predicted glycosyltransferase
MTRLFFHVQYLKGLGHLQRARLIAEAAAARGLTVDMVSGGLPVPGFAPPGATLHQLPPLQAGPGGFSDLRDAEGQTVDKAWLHARRDAVLDLFHRCAPDVLLVETFPFGRRRFAFELLPLLEAARGRARRPVIACSVRDILQQQPQPERRAEAVARLRHFFDLVLVHGDPEFAALEETFPEADAVRDLITYTGLVAAPATEFAPLDDTPRGEVLVSMGGGAVGPDLLWAALEARAVSPLSEAPWRLLTGPHLAEDDFAALTAHAPTDVSVERFRSDFRRLLSAARLSISYAGYNTATDVLRAGVPAVLVSYSGDGGETEQAARAERLARLGRAATLPDSALTPQQLARAIMAALALSPKGTAALDLEGAEKSAALLATLGARSRTP